MNMTQPGGPQSKSLNDLLVTLTDAGFKNILRPSTVHKRQFPMLFNDRKHYFFPFVERSQERWISDMKLLRTYIGYNPPTNQNGSSPSSSSSSSSSHATVAAGNSISDLGHYYPKQKLINDLSAPLSKFFQVQQWNPFFTQQKKQKHMKTLNENTSPHHISCTSLYLEGQNGTILDGSELDSVHNRKYCDTFAFLPERTLLERLHEKILDATFDIDGVPTTREKFTDWFFAFHGPCYKRAIDMISHLPSELPEAPMDASRFVELLKKSAKARLSNTGEGSSEEDEDTDKQIQHEFTTLLSSLGVLASSAVANVPGIVQAVLNIKAQSISSELKSVAKDMGISLGRKEYVGFVHKKLNALLQSNFGLDLGAVDQYLIGSNVIYQTMMAQLNIVKRGVPYEEGIGVSRDVLEPAREATKECSGRFFEQMQERTGTTRTSDGKLTMLLFAQHDGVAGGRSTTGAYTAKGEKVLTASFIAAAGDGAMTLSGHGRYGWGLWTGQDHYSQTFFQLEPHLARLDRKYFLF